MLEKGLSIEQVVDYWVEYYLCLYFPFAQSARVLETDFQSVDPEQLFGSNPLLHEDNVISVGPND